MHDHQRKGHMKCEYASKYYDYDLGKVVLYECPYEVYRDRFCKFHDPEYVTEDTKGEMEKLFLAHLSEALESHKPMKCIGHNIGYIRSYMLPSTKFTVPIYFDNATFRSRVDFAECEFSYASFVGAVFHEGASFTRATFLNLANFENAKFQKDASFGGAAFRDQANFDNVCFMAEMWFVKAEFHARVSFSGVLVLGRAEWAGATFYSTLNLHASFRDMANFEACNFSDLTDLSGTVVEQGYRFRSSVFKKEVNFKGGRFSGGGNFTSVLFVDTANLSADFESPNFNDSIFRGAVTFGGFSSKGVLSSPSFSRVTFEKDVDFSNVDFKFGAYFEDAIFNGPVRFRHSRDADLRYYVLMDGNAYFTDHSQMSGNAKKLSFGGPVDFSRAKFAYGQAPLDFSEFVFEGGASFALTRFNCSVLFRGAAFGRKVFFTGAAFNDAVNFSDAIFNAEADFTGAAFNDAVNFSDAIFGDHVALQKVAFKNQDRTEFTGNLTKVSFLDTDISRVRFRGRISWNSMNVKSGRDGISDAGQTLMENFEIHDGRRLEKDNLCLESVIAEYRGLRENFEYYLKYEEAGQFFVREMELRRLYEERNGYTTKKTRLRQILNLHSVYYGVAKYGESYRRPFLIASIVFVAATTFFWYEGAKDSYQTLDFLKALNILKVSVERSIRSFFPFFELPSNPGVVDYILRTTMLPITGILFVSLRRRYERRFRH